MEKIIIPKTDLNVSRLCLGGCPMGGYGWGDVDNKLLLDAINTAVDNGINFIDTADVYGLGESEKNYGIALGSRRKDVVIATKFGCHTVNKVTTYDNSREYVFNAIEGSLKRLNTDYIDIYQVHYRDGVTPLSELTETLQILKKQGKIRYFGLSNIHKEDEEELKEFGKYYITFQDEYSLACRKNERDMKTFSSSFGLTPMTWGSLGQGILSGKYDKNCKFESNDRRSREIYVNFHGEKLLKNLEIVEVLKKIANETNKSIPSVAIRWILDYLKGSIVIAGVKNPNQVMSNLQALDWNLTKEQILELDNVSKE